MVKQYYNVIHDGRRVTNQVLINEEIKIRLSSSNLLSSGLLSNKVKIKIHKTTILRLIFLMDLKLGL
jgi:hypothetical protein